MAQQQRNVDLLPYRDLCLAFIFLVPAIPECGHGVDTHNSFTQFGEFYCKVFKVGLNAEHFVLSGQGTLGLKSVRQISQLGYSNLSIIRLSSTAKSPNPLFLNNLHFITITNIIFRVLSHTALHMACIISHHYISIHIGIVYFCSILIFAYCEYNSGGLQQHHV